MTPTDGRSRSAPSGTASSGPCLAGSEAAPLASLRQRLEDHRTAILERWRALVFGGYPAEAVRFFRSEADPFRNPVGYSILRGTEVIYDGVALGGHASVLEALEVLVRLRAVQELPASEAVGFVFSLKRAVREHLRESGAEGALWPELAGLDEKLDALASTAFELYSQCRERVYRIRADELRRSTALLLKRLEGGAEGERRTTTAGAEVGHEGGCEP